MRYKIRLSYDGSAFCGWQIQNNARTLQGELEKALSTLLGSTIQVTGAGRTDSDVNAIGYIAHFDVPDEVSVEAAHLCYKLNAMLPREMAVHEVSVASEDFHARFDARMREYHYFIHFRKDPFCEKYSYRMRYPLDIEKMNEAAGAHGVIIPKRRSAGLTGTVYKTSAGAVEYVPVARVSNLSDTIRELKKQGLWIYGLDMNGESWCGTDLTGAVGIVVGSEGQGIGRLVREQCDGILSLPMKGQINSLNASVATGIVLYEVARQRDGIRAR